MRPSLPPAPAAGTTDITIPSEHFNRVRLGLLRLGAPLQIILGNRNLEFQLSYEAWVCYDRRLGAQPIVAWTGFEVGRDELHAPVRAKALLYNSYATLYLHTVVPDLALRLERTLAEAGRRGARIVAFPRKP